jgi:flavin-dependent dehydrogenase
MIAHFDICVLGGGPSGATVAARLTRLGHRVALIEQRPFPRPHVGESLSPGIWPLLDVLDVPRNVVRDAVAVTEAAIRWRAGEEHIPVHDRVTVDRATLDSVLLNRARAAGATVLSPVRAGPPVREAGGWRVPVGNGVLHADVLTDASGRRRLLGGHRTWTSPRTLAVHARWPAGPPARAPQMFVDTLPEGWLWAARLPGNDVRAMAFVDPQTLASEAGGPGRLLRQLLRSSALLSQRLPARWPPSRVEVCDATGYVVDQPIGPYHVRVGEAAFAIDPLSSCGVQTAIQSGLVAAAAVHTMLTPGGDTAAALEYYAELQRASVAHHRRTAARLYATHQRCAEEPFWQRRSSGEQSPAPEPLPGSLPGSLADLLGHRVRLRAPAALRDSACVVGDVIARRPALHHPGLDRPVAFLGGLELGPLLRDLQGAPSLAAAMLRWERILPPGRGAQIVRWLLCRALLERAP